MPRLTRRLPGFESVSGGSTATCRIPVGVTYAQIWLETTGLTLANMPELRVIANGETIQRFSATELNLMNTYFGRKSSDAGELVIDFTRPHLLTRAGQQETMLGAAPFDPQLNPNPIINLSLEIDIAAGVAAPSIKGTAIVDNPAGVGNILKIRKFAYSAPAVGLYEIADIPKGEGAIDSIFFLTNDITFLQIEKDNNIIFERSADLNKAIQLDGYFRTPDGDNFFAYNPGEEGFGSELLSTLNPYGTGYVSDLRFKCTMSAAGSIPIIVRYIGGLQS